MACVSQSSGARAFQCLREHAAWSRALLGWIALVSAAAQASAGCTSVTANTTPQGPDPKSAAFAGLDDKFYGEDSEASDWYPEVEVLASVRIIRERDGTGSIIDVPTFDIHRRRYNNFKLGLDGSLGSQEEYTQMLDAFRCFRTGQERDIHPMLLGILADLSAEYPAQVIEIVSAYRAPPYGVPKSRHFQGRAMDLRIRGVEVTEVRDYLWHRHADVGVGYYEGDDFVHVDYRPGYHKTGWTQGGTNDPYQYGPSWSR